ELRAYEEATSLFQGALALLDRQAPSEACERGELLLGLARAAVRAGDAARAQAATSDAVAEARRIGSPALLAEAGLVPYPGDGTTPDPEWIALLEEALATLAPHPSSLRVRVLGRLAWELTGTPQSARQEAL